MPSVRQDNDFAEELSSHVNVKATALDSAIAWIRDNLDPDDIFTYTHLQKWADQNGYIKS